MNLCKGLYSDTNVYSACDSSARELFAITSGIAHGCSLGGWLGTDPAARSLVDAVEPTSDGAVRAAADVVGAALAARKALAPVHGRFQLMERAAGPSPQASHMCPRPPVVRKCM